MHSYRGMNTDENHTNWREVASTISSYRQMHRVAEHNVLMRARKKFDALVKALDAA